MALLPLPASATVQTISHRGIATSSRLTAHVLAKVGDRRSAHLCVIRAAHCASLQLGIISATRAHSCTRPDQLTARGAGTPRVWVSLDGCSHAVDLLLRRVRVPLPSTRKL